MTSSLRVLWTHNFAPSKPNSLVFINVAAEGLRSHGIEIELQYLGNLRSPSKLLSARAGMARRARGFDVVHAQYGSACALATAGARGIPKVVSIRGNDWNLHSETIGFLYIHTRLARAMTRASLGAFDCVIPVSHRLAKELAPLVPGRHCEVMPSPIDLTRFVPRDKAEARARLGCGGDTRKWVLFNALDLDDRVKRYPLAKAAFDLAQQRLGNLVLRLAHGLAHDELPLFVAACDVILCTSETEGWPNSVKEALACNVPFVSTDVSDLPDIAGREPSCRICLPDTEALAQGLGDVLMSAETANLRLQVTDMGQNASSVALARLYESLVASGRATA